MHTDMRGRARRQVPLNLVLDYSFLQNQTNGKTSLTEPQQVSTTATTL